MAHFAELDDQNIVVRVIVVNNDDCGGGDYPLSDPIGSAFCANLFGGIWKQTSYNSRFRKQYAGIGYQYLPDADVFVTPQPAPTWSLNPNTYDWEPPLLPSEHD